MYSLANSIGGLWPEISRVFGCRKIVRISSFCQKIVIKNAKRGAVNQFLGNLEPPVISSVGDLELSC